MIRAIARKELTTTWLSPVPWVAGVLFHVTLGLLYTTELQSRGQALIQPLFPLAGFLLVVLTPIITMRSFVEESRTGSLDILQAIPVSTGSLVTAKWLGAWLTSLGIIVPSLTAAVLLVLFGEPDPGPIAAGFAGLSLMSAALCAIGIGASAATSSQPVAGVATFFLSLLLWFAHAGSQTLPTGGLLAHFSISERLRSFSSGLIDSSDVGFLILLTMAALIISATAIDARRIR